MTEPSKSKTRIAFFSLNAYSLFDNSCLAPTGGTEVQLFILSKHFALNDNFHTCFITGNWGQSSITTKERVVIFRSASLTKNLLNYFAAPLKILLALTKCDADIVIASSVGIEIGLIALYCIIANKIFIFRTASSVDCTNEKIKMLGFPAGLIYKFGLRHADTVVVQSSEYQHALLEHHNKLSTIIKNAFPPSINTSPKEDFALWVGSARSVKQPELFLALAKQLPTRNFVMIMTKSDNSFLWQTINKECKHIHNIKLISKVPFDKIQTYFDRAKILVGTSKYEGFPNVYIQACMGKTPIVSLNVNPDDFITKNNLGYCSNNNFDEMRKSVSKLFDDHNDYVTKSNNAFNYTKTNHSIFKISKQWEELFHQLKDID